MRRRELSKRDAEIQALALQDYLDKPNNRGAVEWFRSKDFGPADRAAILLALSDLGEELPKLALPKPKKLSKREHKRLRAQQAPLRAAKADQRKRRLHERCWKLMSRCVRESAAGPDGMAECYTCGARKEWKRLQAGHYRHGVLDFDPMNVKPQCEFCNSWKHGFPDAFRGHLLDNGFAVVEELERRASAFTGYTYAELLDIEADLKAKLKRLDEVNRG